MDLVIRSEEDAWLALERATSGDGFQDDVHLVCDGWPVFKMDVKGKDWSSTVPTRIMSPFLDVQRDINRAYASVRYGTPNLRKLKDEERDDIEVVVKVGEGSSLFDAELWKQLNTIAEAAVLRMNGNQVVITVLGIGLMLTAPVLYRAWLAHRQREKEMETQIALSDRETERMRIFAEALGRQPILEATKEDISDTRNRMLKVVRPGDVMTTGTVPVPAEEAAALVHPERARAEDHFMEGEFVVLGNRTDKGEGFRITLRSLENDMTLQADVPPELPYHQQQLIQDAEWGKKKVLLSINASLLRGKVSDAVVISAREASDAGASSQATR